METLKLKTRSGIAKLVGIIVCLGGAATLAFYQGPGFKIFCIHNIFGHHNYLSIHQQTLHTTTSNSGKTWIKGCFLMLLSNTLWGMWIVLQGRVLKSYPSKLLLTTVQCLMSSVQSFAIAIAFVRDPREWKLGWNVRLVSVAYCGIVVTGFTFYLQAWVIEKKGPVFLAMSTPLNLIFTMFCSAFLLCQFTTSGSVVGGLLLVLGLYSVLWAKSKEEEKPNKETTINCFKNITSELELEHKDSPQGSKQVEVVPTKGPLLV